MPHNPLEKNNFSQVNNPKTLYLSGYHNLTNGILIDDSDPDYNWTKTAAENDWCSGSGTWVNPYIIEEVYINNNGISIRNSEVYFSIQNSIIFNGEIDFLNTQNGKILNSTCSNDSIGIFIRRGQNFTISNNSLNNITYRAMDIEEVNNTVISKNVICNVNGGIHVGGDENITISENTINILLRPFDVPVGIDFFGGDNSYLLNNKVEDGVIWIDGDASLFGNQVYRSGFMINFLYNIELDNSNLVNNKPVYFYENKTGLRPDDFANAGQVILFNCNDSIISNLEISYTYRALEFFHCNNNTISYNNLSYNQGYGILARRSSNLIIENNIISNNHTFGLDLRRCYNCVIRDNTIHKNLNMGISVYICHNNTLYGNTISEGSLYGIWLIVSSNVSLINNVVLKNKWGIYCYGENNTILLNLIKDNYEYGINIGSHANLIYYNCFINNSVHAYDNGDYNRWDNGIVGNYWDNYTGSDENGDGIGDIPYIIPGSAHSKDNFPLMNCPLPVEDEQQEISGYYIIYIIIIINSLALIMIIKIKKLSFIKDQ